MDYSGLVKKYPIFRQLTQNEFNNRLDPSKKLNTTLLEQLCTITINSTYFETVDKYFGFKGFATLVNFGAILLSLSGMSWISKIIFIDQWNTLSNREMTNAITAWGSVLVVFAALILVVIWLLKKEAFAWTHYPIRLNRKNRMVYVFRTNGTVLSVPWDEVFFCLDFGPRGLGNIRGHVLSKETQRVQETFAFSAVSTSRDILLGHWEFLRRYMEEGPQSVIDEVVYCMPIEGKYESFKSGMERIFANDANFSAGLRLLLWPLNFLTTLARFFAMRTSKIPVWPKEVEDACKVDPGDPYIKDSRINPPGLR